MLGGALIYQGPLWAFMNEGPTRMAGPTRICEKHYGMDMIGHDHHLIKH